jgi:hypothetical protein
VIRIFQDFMKNYADPRVFEAIDWSRVEVFPTHSFDLNNKELIADLIFTCGVCDDPDGKVGVVVLFEITGKNIFYLPKRFLQYLVGVWNQFADDESVQKPLPLPYFIVVRIGKGNKHKGTKYPKTSDMCINVEGIDFVKGLDFEYDVIELSSYKSVDDLAGGTELRVALGVVKASTEGKANIEEEFKTVSKIARDCPEYEKKKFMLKNSLQLLNNVLRARGRNFNAEVLDDIVSEVLTDKKETEYMKGSIFDDLISEGKAKGIAIGEARGEIQGEAKSVVRVLEERFERVPKTINKRVLSIKDDARLSSLLI